MTRHLLYLLFGLFVISTYTFAARTGAMLGAFSHTPAPPSAGARAGTGVVRAAPSFWSTGYLGGK